MATNELGGYNASIKKRDWLKEPLNAERIFETFKEQFEEDDVAPGTIKSIILRDSRDRQTIMSYNDEAMLKMLVSTEKEADHPDLISALRCLGYFPEQEKKFLLSVLQSERTDAEKFAYLEEAIFTASKEHLEYYRGVDNAEQQKQNRAIANESTLYMDENRDGFIKAAVENVLGLGDSPDDPFPQSAEYYGVAGGAGSRSLRTTYEICTSGNRALRILHLKRLLLAASEAGDGIFLVKFICSHCSLDLKSIVDCVSEEGMTEKDLADIEKYLGLKDFMSRQLTAKDLIEPIGIQGDSLKKFLHMAAFGPQ